MTREQSPCRHYPRLPLRRPKRHLISAQLHRKSSWLANSISRGSAVREHSVSTPMTRQFAMTSRRGSRQRKVKREARVLDLDAPKLASPRRWVLLLLSWRDWKLVRALTPPTHSVWTKPVRESMPPTYSGSTRPARLLATPTHSSTRRIVRVLALHTYSVWRLPVRVLALPTNSSTRITSVAIVEGRVLEGFRGL